MLVCIGNCSLCFSSLEKLCWSAGIIRCCYLYHQVIIGKSTGSDWGRPVTEVGLKTFALKIQTDGGFEYYAKGGGLDRSKCLLVIILPEEEWKKRGEAQFVDEMAEEGNAILDENGNIVLGKGPKLGPGITNLGQYFILMDGGHRWLVLKKK